MKANQKFANADDGVSPVIGVILMVAITVVLAAVVFVLVQDLGGGSDLKPQITFTKDEAANALTVATIEYAGNTIEWADITIGGAGCTKPTSDTDVSAGDILTSCGIGKVSISHGPTETLLYETTFV